MDALKTRPLVHSKNAKLIPAQQDVLVKIILTNKPTVYSFIKLFGNQAVFFPIVSANQPLT